MLIAFGGVHRGQMSILCMLGGDGEEKVGDFELILMKFEYCFSDKKL